MDTAVQNTICKSYGKQSLLQKNIPLNHINYKKNQYFCQFPEVSV